MLHPREVLLGAQAAAARLPVCDHYSGTPLRMQKSLQLQAQMLSEHGRCLFDVTLDCEDGAAAGGEVEHAAHVVELVRGAMPGARVAVRVHPVGHPAFESDVACIVGAVGYRLAHLMLPKVESLTDVQRAAQAVDSAGAPNLPLHVLLESSAAVHRAFEIAAHPRVQSISFGLMDFVSTHAGAIPAEAMSATGQFSHPLVLRAKLEIAAACHAHGKPPSHNVVTEYADSGAVQTAASRAARELGYTRMWSIHPSQIEPILAAFSPTADELDEAATLIAAAYAAQWAPISHRSRLHDRASYRYYWQCLERAYQTGQSLPACVRGFFDDADARAGGSLQA